MANLNEVIVRDATKGFMFESDKKPFSPRFVEFPIILESVSGETLEVEVIDPSEFEGHFETVASDGRARIISKK